MNPLVIIHGWSDDSRSFEHLVSALKKYDKRQARFINLADYITMDDHVTYDDLIAAMAWAWERQHLPEEPGSVDAIVHSTGALVIRHWLTQYYTPHNAPIKHLVMLAPANFGSALAHKGRAFIGRVVRGFNSKKIFQVGEKLLKGLELASPFTWDLAMLDRFNQESFYGPGKILCTVLVGDTGYTGIAAAANERGADGTVRIACANMNCALMDIHFNDDPETPRYSWRDSNGLIAFAIRHGENHQSIIGQDHGYQQVKTLERIAQALVVEDSDFADWCSDLEQEAKTDSAYQNIVIHVKDQYGAQVQDYFIEFYEAGAKQPVFTQLFHEQIAKTVHSYGGNTSFRSLYMDCNKFYAYLEPHTSAIRLGLTALPQLGAQGNQVGYRHFADDTLGAISIPRQDVRKIFVENRTLLVRVTLKREQVDDVFTFRTAK